MTKAELEAEVWRPSARATALETLLVHFMEALVLSGQIPASTVHSAFDETLTSTRTVGSSMTGTIPDIHATRITDAIGKIRKMLQLPH